MYICGVQASLSGQRWQEAVRCRPSSLAHAGELREDRLGLRGVRMCLTNGPSTEGVSGIVSSGLMTCSVGLWCDLYTCAMWPMLHLLFCDVCAADLTNNAGLASCLPSLKRLSSENCHVDSCPNRFQSSPELPTQEPSSVSHPGEIVLAAVDTSGFALQFASPRLQLATLHSGVCLRMNQGRVRMLRVLLFGICARLR